MGMELSNEKKRAWILFLVAHSVVTRKIDCKLAEAGFPGLEVYDALLTLEDAPVEGLRMSEFADRVMLSRSGITRLADRLEREGLIARCDCPKDRRATYAVITKKGLALREAMWPVFRNGIVEFFANHLSVEEALVMAAGLEKVLEGLPQELLHGMPCLS